MDFASYLKNTATELNIKTQKLLSNWIKEVRLINKELLPLTSKFADACYGGKQVRGILVRLGYGLVKARPNPEIITVGAAYEILHASILVHDDIMDQSPLRRGEPSLYKTLGESMAMALGDLGFFLSIKIILGSKFDQALKLKALALFTKTLVDTAVGQIMDLKKLDPVTTAKLKTARYTIAAPLQLGATLAGGKDKQVKLLGEFGEYVGIAFQIRDDILDGEAQENAKEKAQEYASRAKKMIPKITEDQVMMKILQEMVDYLVERTA